MIHTALIVGHIIVGAAGLLIGPAAMLQDSRRFVAGRRTTGPASGVYRWVVLLICLSAIGLVIEHRRDLWWLIPVAALTYLLALLARESARRRYPGWLHGYVHGQGGSYIALCTALIVVATTARVRFTSSASPKCSRASRNTSSGTWVWLTWVTASAQASAARSRPL